MYTIVMTDDHLEHHGILGQKWGLRRFQNKDGSLTTAGKKRATGQRGSYVAQMAVKKKQQEQVKAEKQVAKNEKMKAKIVKKRSAKEVYKHADLFSDDELRTLTNRLKLEKDLKDISPSLVDKGKKTVAGIGILGDGLSKISYAVDSGTKAWNNTAKVMNSLYGTNMKIIGDKPKNEPQATSRKSYTYDDRGRMTLSTVTNYDGRGNQTTEIRNYRYDEDQRNNH